MAPDNKKSNYRISLKRLNKINNLIPAQPLIKRIEKNLEALRRNKAELK
jgi:hypothetical protein